MKNFAVIERTRLALKDGKIIDERMPSQVVEVLAEGAGYLMVRFKRCIPFVIQESEVEARYSARSWAKVLEAVKL